MTRPVILTLILSILGLSALAYKQYQALVAIDLTEASSTKNAELPSPASPVSIESPPLSSYQTIVERPLFSQNRRPAEDAPEVKTTTQRPTRKPDLTLTGIVLSDGEEIALLTKKRDPKVQRVKQGEQIDGWTVSAITALNVVLSSGGENISLDLLRKSDPNAARKQATNTPPKIPPPAPDANNDIPTAPEDVFSPTNPGPFEEELLDDD